MTDLTHYYTYEQMTAAKERAHRLRAQSIDWALNDVVAGAVRKSAAALKRGALSLFLPSETRQW